MKPIPERFGHVTALFTILVWGITFVSTKILLRSFSPIEILFTRFLLGFIALTIISPVRLRVASRRDEFLFIGAGLTGITMYFLLENIALTMTTAANVGVIVSVTPFFTAFMSHRFLHTARPNLMFYIGFVFAVSGVALLSIGSGGTLAWNPRGDILAILAAVVWSLYSVIVKKITARGYASIAVTRRSFLYGLIGMIPALFLMDFRFGPERFADPATVGHILFLGLGASAMCFVTWNMSVRLLGAVRTSMYIYLVPVVTVASAVVFLGEALTAPLIVGTALTLLGLWLSETTAFSKKSQPSQP
ncbi:MAG: DMT family transporter [Planctomycetes bacterium]|nr:DMT family transporter [Planctomycetota bacterium]MCD7897833.1 DMT family transporter [Planctomycetaceae bacterium]